VKAAKKKICFQRRLNPDKAKSFSDKPFEQLHEAMLSFHYPDG
jgi:hypothetical protein